MNGPVRRHRQGVGAQPFDFLAEVPLSSSALTTTAPGAIPSLPDRATVNRLLNP